MPVEVHDGGRLVLDLVIGFGVALTHFRIITMSKLLASPATLFAVRAFDIVCGAATSGDTCIVETACTGISRIRFGVALTHFRTIT